MLYIYENIINIKVIIKFNTCLIFNLVNCVFRVCMSFMDYFYFYKRMRLRGGTKTLSNIESENNLTLWDVERLDARKS